MTDSARASIQRILARYSLMLRVDAPQRADELYREMLEMSAGGQLSPPPDSPPPDLERLPDSPAEVLEEQNYSVYYLCSAAPESRDKKIRRKKSINIS